MAIQTSCPSCDATYTLADTQRGKKVRCRKCSETFTVGGGKDADAPSSSAKSGKSLRKDALQNSPRPTAKSTPPPKSKSKAPTRRPRDDDDEEDDGADPRPNFKKKAGSSTPMILMIIGGVVLLVLLCGGGGTFAVYWWVSSTVSNGVDNLTQDMQDQIREANAGAPIGQPANPGFPNVPLPDLTLCKDVNEALDWVKNGSADKKNKGADWLSKSAVDNARQKEVAAELEKLIANPNTRDTGIRALAVWAGPEDAPTLCQELDTNGNLWQWDKAGGAVGDALVRLQYQPAADMFAKRLPDFFQHGNAARRLSQMGAALAEKAVLKYMNSADGNAHSEAERLLKQFGTTPDAMFSQCVTDLKSGDAGVERAACDYIAKTPVNEARRAEVSKALETPLADGTNGDTRKAAAVALKNWGTKDNVPALIAEMDRADDPFHGTRAACMEALGKLKDERGAAAVAAHWPDGGFGNGDVVRSLRDMGPVAEKAVAGFVNHPDPNIQRAAQQLLKEYGTNGNVTFNVMVDDLNAVDANQRKRALDFLVTQPVDDAHQKQVARALDKMLPANNDTDPFGQTRKAAARAEIGWGDKESVPALIDGMERDNSDIAVECMQALGRINDERAVVPLLLQTATGKSHIGEAQKALIAMGPTVETALDKDLTDPTKNPLHKVGICTQLAGKLGTKASIPALTAACADPNPQVKAAAKAALAVVQKRNP